MGDDLTFISAVGDDNEKSDIIRNSLKRVKVVRNFLYNSNLEHFRTLCQVWIKDSSFFCNS